MVDKGEIDSPLTGSADSHTHLTRLYILKKHQSPQYEHCQCVLTARHMLVYHVQIKKYLTGKNDVVEDSCRFHSKSFCYPV